MSKPRPLELHIDRLVLRSLPPGGEHRLRQAVEAELTRLIAAEAQHPGRPVAPLLRPGRRPPEQAAAVGIAETIHRKLTGMPTRPR
jgi:hypothetical protein